MASEDSHPFRWRYPDLDDKNFQIHSQSLLLSFIFLFVLLFITFLFVYALYICTYRRQSATARTTPNRTAPPARSSGLDPVTIHGLPVYLHGSSVTTTTTCEEPECSICLSSFQDGENVKVLPECDHAFHSECVDKWLATQSSCPLCRAPVLRVDSFLDPDIP